MKKEIKINNSKLKIVPLNFTSGDKEVVITNKQNLKYQFLVLTPKDFYNKKKSCYKYIDAGGMKKVFISPVVSKDFDDCWSLEYTKGIDNYKGEVYTKDELNVILSFLSLTILNHQDTSEILSICTNDKNIISKYYSSYGKQGLEEFKSYIKNIIRDRDYKINPKDSGVTPLNYLRDKYSVQNLISDLILDNAEISTNKYILGKELERISKEVIDTSSKTVSKLENWVKIKGIVGNKKRANLSLRYDKKVLVYIPENKFGIKEGLTEFNSIGSICIIKDGNLWQEKLGVKISNKLAGKLKRLKVIENELIPKSGEYLVDLTKLPVISKSRIREITSEYLSKLEIRSLLADIALEYINYIDCPIEKDESTKFLESLGIYEGFYKPTSTMTMPTTRSYEAVELITEISGLPENKSERIKLFNNHKSSLDSGILKGLLNKIDEDIKNNGFENIKDLYKKNSNKLKEELRDRKFQIIMSKSSRFSEKNYPFIDSIKKDVPITIPGISDTIRLVSVSWKFKTKKVYI